MQKQADNLAESFLNWIYSTCMLHNYGFNLTKVNISCNCDGRYPLDANDFDLTWQPFIRLCRSLQVKFQLAGRRNGVMIAVHLRLCELCMKKTTMTQDDTCILWPHFHRGSHNLMKSALFWNCCTCVSYTSRMCHGDNRPPTGEFNPILRNVQSNFVSFEDNCLA